MVDLLLNNSNFDSDINVSVFETNIRIVGGLLSAHLLSRRAGVVLEPGWPCNGPLLRMAEDVAKRLLPAFDTRTGMPYGTVNLKHGVPPGETSITCTACVGTFIVEFGALSRLTGDPIYEEVAINALIALFQHKSPIGLFGNHIDVQSGRWTAHDAGIGAGVDSYYEYLVKGSIMLNKPELMKMFNEGRVGIEKYLKRDDWHIWASMNKGHVTLPVFQSLEAYWPGVLSLIGDINGAMKTLHNYHSVWRQYGFLPEFYNIPNAEAGANRENYPLRPELIESVMYLYRSTGDPFLLQVAEDILRSIQHSGKTPCGYATIKNVRDHRKEDRMESFFLAETTKYLYLVFDPDNFLNNDGSVGEVVNTPYGECVIDAGGYIFNTEAHPIDPAALRCCHEMPRLDLMASYNRKDYLGDVFEFDRTFVEEVEKAEKEDSFARETTTTVEIDAEFIESPTQVSIEETKKRLIFEILNLINQKRATEENVKQNAAKNDDIILPVQKEANKDGKSKPVEGDNVEIIKTAQIPDSDENNNSLSQTDKTRLSEPGETSKNVTIPVKIDQADVKDLPSYLAKDNPPQIRPAEEDSSKNNNSILTDFVHSILKTTALSEKPYQKFDPQKLLDNIRKMNLKANITHLGETDYKLLTCKAQSYLQRISVFGEFF